MPKRGIDAGSRLFFDELESLAASRLKATRAIRLEDRYGVIAFSDEDHVVKRQSSSASPIRNSRMAVELFHLSEMRRQETEALARRGRAALPELPLVLRCA